MGKFVGAGFETGPTASERSDMVLVGPDNGVCTCGCLYRFHSIEAPHRCVRCITRESAVGLDKCPAYCPAVITTRKKFVEILLAWAEVQTENAGQEWTTDESFRGNILAVDGYGEKRSLIQVMNAPKLAQFLSGLQDTMSFLLNTLREELHDSTERVATDGELADREAAQGAGGVKGSILVWHRFKGKNAAYPTKGRCATCSYGIVDKHHAVPSEPGSDSDDCFYYFEEPGAENLGAVCAEFVPGNGFACGRCRADKSLHVEEERGPLKRFAGEQHDFIRLNPNEVGGPCKLCSLVFSDEVHTYGEGVWLSRV